MRAQAKHVLAKTGDGAPSGRSVQFGAEGGGSSGPASVEAMPAESFVTVLKAIAEPTRIRILVLLQLSELNVKDLMQILRQSQPRLSRHLKLMFEAGLLDRFREGSWVFFRLSASARAGALAQLLTAFIDPDDPLLVRDRERLGAVKKDREAAAQAYFASHAGDWDRIRALHAPEQAVEQAMRECLHEQPVGLLVDLGTGTGRTLELFADLYDRAIGFDVSQSMLAYARSKLEQQGLVTAQVRHGDIYNIALDGDVADVVVMHQVLHFLSDAAGALAEAARILKPGGTLIIVDFAPHGVEFLREQHAHERLGFASEQIMEWVSACGLALDDEREMAPEFDQEERLTVKVWRAHKQRDEEAATASLRDVQSDARPELLEEIK